MLPKYVALFLDLAQSLTRDLSNNYPYQHFGFLILNWIFILSKYAILALFKRSNTKLCNRYDLARISTIRQKYFYIYILNISIDILRITSKYVSNTTESGIDYLFGLKEATICFLFHSFYANYDSMNVLTNDKA